MFDGRYKRQTIEDQFKELNNLENKCHEYFKSINDMKLRKAKKLN